MVAGLEVRTVASAGGWKACGSRLVDDGQQVVPGGVRSETAAAGGLGIRKTGSSTLKNGSGSCCRQAAAGAEAAVGAASTRVEVAASCGVLAEEHTAAAAAAGTEAGIEAGTACESRRRSAEEASAGSLWLAAGRPGPCHPCLDGGEQPEKSCWRWTRSEGARP